jgi:hypothetical protein
MAKPWTELWSFGSGAQRSYCVIERTEEGFALDVFRGDTCIESDVFETRDQAERVARGLEAQYQMAQPWVVAAVH